MNEIESNKVIKVEEKGKISKIFTYIRGKMDKLDGDRRNGESDSDEEYEVYNGNYIVVFGPAGNGKTSLINSLLNISCKSEINVTPVTNGITIIKDFDHHTIQSDQYRIVDTCGLNLSTDMDIYKSSKKLKKFIKKNIDQISLFIFVTSGRISDVKMLNYKEYYLDFNNNPDKKKNKKIICVQTNIDDSDFGQWEKENGDVYESNGMYFDSVIATSFISTNDSNDPQNITNIERKKESTERVMSTIVRLLEIK